MMTWRRHSVEPFARRRRQQIRLDAGGDAERSRDAEQQRQRSDVDGRA